MEKTQKVSCIDFLCRTICREVQRVPSLRVHFCPSLACLEAVIYSRDAVKSTSTCHPPHALSDVLLFRSDGLAGREPRSMLLLTLLLDDLLLRSRSSFGSAVSSPPALANKIKMSVRLITPTSPPLSLAPSIEFAEADGPVCVIIGVFGVASATEYGSEEVA